MKTCPDCGTQNPVDQPFCSSCGWRFHAPQSLAADTIPEGHPAVPKRPPTKEEIPQVSAQEEEQADNRFRYGLIAAGLLLVLSVSLVLFDSSESGVSLGENTVVTIAGGNVETALPDNARALMMMACQRLEKEDDACEEATLFEGEFPSRRVDVAAFNIDTHEVRNTAYNECVKSGKCGFDDCVVYTHDGKQFDSKAPKSLSREALPKVCVSFENAKAFCETQGGTLPTKTQFIAAAREGTERTFPWGDHWDPTLTNWAERDLLQTPVLGAIDGFGFTAPPGSFPKGCTKAGVCDLAGNVAEWVIGDDKQPRIQGGAWTDRPFDLRVTRALPESNARTDVGFRCVYPVSAPE